MLLPLMETGWKMRRWICKRFEFWELWKRTIDMAGDLTPSNLQPANTTNQFKFAESALFSRHSRRSQLPLKTTQQSTCSISKLSEASQFDGRDIPGYGVFPTTAPWACDEPNRSCVCVKGSKWLLWTQDVRKMNKAQELHLTNFSSDF